MIAYTHVQMGAPQKALEVGQSGLPLARASDDGKAQAYLLDTIGSAYDAMGEKKKEL